MNEVLLFIETIKEFDKHGDIAELFTKRYCYGFALMLKQQFKHGSIYWDRSLNHAIFEVDKRFYDINGEYFPQSYKRLEHIDVQIIEIGRGGIFDE